VFKAGSEHTVEDERFDLELQIFHLIHAEDEDETAVDGEEEADAGGGGHRRLARHRRNLATGQSYKEQVEFHGFYESSVALLFSLEHYTHVSDLIIEEFDHFFDGLSF